MERVPNPSDQVCSHDKNPSYYNPRCQQFRDSFPEFDWEKNPVVKIMSVVRKYLWTLNKTSEQTPDFFSADTTKTKVIPFASIHKLRMLVMAGVVPAFQMPRRVRMGIAM